MEIMNTNFILEHLYKEVGDMLSRAKTTFPRDSEDLRKLELAYGGVETIKYRAPSCGAWWREAAAGLEAIRTQLVTLSENKLYTQ
ncbi:hypothetical protein [Cohnella lupini]|uniref:Uncharacterized protein n=1 Tax=Cohnella lupini TaxID=1294267 RepID=A0A3D9IIS3_9BACL|nr:hypothetical protein [Cohnella lupini]RED61638.1 hypothetical protein DFP95_10566 [Cohnella lupini]